MRGFGKEDLKTFAKVMFCVFVVPLVLFVIVSNYITSIFPRSDWAYALQYGTTTEYVAIEPKPHDCEYDKAPLGNKYCHFERNVTQRKSDDEKGRHTQVLVSWYKVED